MRLPGPTRPGGAIPPAYSPDFSIDLIYEGRFTLSNCMYASVLHKSAFHFALHPQKSDKLLTSLIVDISK